MILITDKPYKAGEGGFAVHLHDDVYIDTECVVGCDGYCEECIIAQNYNLEDDDTPCLNCGVDDAP